MKIYLVGGAVRDNLLGIPVKERDWVVIGSTPEEMIGLGYKQVGSDFPVFLHPDTKEAYALARTERKSGKGHKGFTVNSDKNITLEEDLKRRDLTINAIAKSETGEIIDPCKGQEDIQARVLRKVSDAFREDPLRVLRVARFSAKLKYLNFSIDKETLESMKTIANSGELKTLPTERIWQETFKALQERNPEEFFKVLIQSESINVFTRNATINFIVFKKISTEIKEPEMRWASLTNCLDGNFENLNKAFGVPKKIHELSNVLKRLVDFGLKYKTGVKSNELLDLIEGVDGFRRNNRFNKAVELLNLFNKSVPQPENITIPWNTLIKILSSVKPSSKRLKDKEIAEDIRCQRLNIIDQALKKG